MLWTHFYDLIFKLITMAIAFVLVTQIPFFADKDVLAVLLILVFYFVVYNAIFRTFASYLYCRFTLKNGC